MNEVKRNPQLCSPFEFVVSSIPQSFSFLLKIYLTPTD